MATAATDRLTPDPESRMEPLLDTAEAAHLLHVHPKTLGRWARRGVVPSYCTAGGYRFDLAEVREALRTEAWRPER